MVKVVEWSDNGEDWLPVRKITSLSPAILRETENLAGKEREELRGIIAEFQSKKRQQRPNDIHRIEYSVDGGFSWQEVTFNGDHPVEVKTAHIYRLANTTKGYKVRTLDVIDNRQKATSFKQFTRTEPQVKSGMVNILYDNGKYSWENSTGNWILLPGDKIVSKIEVSVPFRMTMPNSNRIVWTKWTGECDGWEFDRIPPHEATKAANMGHVYKIAPGKTFQGGISALLASPEARKLNFSFDTWSVVTSARLYDDESETIFGLFDKITVLSDKYIVTNNQKSKLGSQFFIRNADIFAICAKMKSIGAYVDLQSNEETHKQGIMSDNSQARAYAEFLTQLLKDSATPEDISKTIALAIDYRDRSVDALKQLNETIMQAKMRLQETLSEANSENEVNSGRS